MVAEEGVVAGFDGEDGRGALDDCGVCGGETGDDVDDGADADGGDDVGEGEEFGGTADWEGVFAGGEGGRVVRFEDVDGRLRVDELLRVHAGDDVDGVVVLVVRVPCCEVLQAFEEECRLHVFEEVDAGKVGDGGGGDVERGGTVGSVATGCGGDGLSQAGKDEGRG